MPRLSVEPVLCSPHLPFLLAAWPLLCGLGDRPSGHGGPWGLPGHPVCPLRAGAKTLLL